MTNGFIQKSMATDEDLAKIREFTRRELARDELYVFNVTLCDNDIDRDYERFSTESLYEMAKLFVGKTGIFDHSMKTSDQKARVYETCVEKVDGKKTLDNRDYYCLKAKAYMLNNAENKSLIDEIDAGIKKEVSVSCSMSKAICSVCGTDLHKSRCEHVRGREYGGKLCFTSLENATDAYEFSFVAVPAQRQAGVTKAFCIKEDYTLQDIVKKLTTGEEVTLTKSQTAELNSYIEQLEEDALLAKSYKGELAKQVVEIFKKAFPQVEEKLFAGVVSVMTTKELLGFSNGIKAQKNMEKIKPQLAVKNDIKQNNHSQFHI